jgi:hypothetical protein
MQSYANYDHLNNLPVDSNPPMQHEQKIVDTLFTSHKPVVQSLLSEGKDSFLVGILFILLSLPQANEIIFKLVPSAETSIYITIAIKAASVALLYWLIKHYYLSRK